MVSSLFVRTFRLLIYLLQPCRELGRFRVEKYRVNYKLVREAHRAGGDQSEPHVSLHYTPLYGCVPGYVVSDLASHFACAL